MLKNKKIISLIIASFVLFLSVFCAVPASAASSPLKVTVYNITEFESTVKWTSSKTMKNTMVYLWNISSRYWMKMSTWSSATSGMSKVSGGYAGRLNHIKVVASDYNGRKYTRIISYRNSFNRGKITDITKKKNHVNVYYREPLGQATTAVLEYSTSSDFSNKKRVRINCNNAAYGFKHTGEYIYRKGKCVVSGIDLSKKYYFRIRFYKTVTDNSYKTKKYTDTLIKTKYSKTYVLS